MASLRSFLTGIIDYAGLFPPAQLDMHEAVKNYAEYRAGKDRELLGRFVVPASRLAEFGDASQRVLERGEGSVPWCLSVLVDGDIAEARKTILSFTSAHLSRSEAGHALCDAVEVRARTEQDVSEATAAFPQHIRRFFELDSAGGERNLLRAVAARHDGEDTRGYTGTALRAVWPVPYGIITASPVLTGSGPGCTCLDAADRHRPLPTPTTLPRKRWAFWSPCTPQHCV